MLRSALRQAHAAIAPLLPPEALLALEKIYFRLYGEAELSLVHRLCRPGQDAIDVGGNQGCYSLLMRDVARRVHVFEPVPWMADRLAGKFRDSLTLHRLALSSAAGSARLTIPQVGGRTVTALATLSPPAGLAGPTIEVPTARLDEVYEGTVGFIKIDVEGHEEAVLAGAPQTIARCRPRLMIEIEERYSPGGRKRISAALAEHGYQGFYLLGGRFLPVDGFDAARLQPAPADGAPPARGSVYVNNFLFLPAEDVASIDSLVHH